MRRNASLQRTHEEGLAPDEPLLDLRFHRLLGDADWNALPPPVRRRFSKHLAGGTAAVYVGEVIETKMSRAGWLIAQLARIAGAPLPTSAMCRVPSVVTVTEDGAGGGQVWTRLYARATRFPQVIHSAKRFSGPTGLEEYAASWIGMALTVRVEDAALVFRSVHYFLKLGRLRLVLPWWLTPGAITVTHRETGAGTFVFTLDVEHRIFGSAIFQEAAFQDAT